MLSLQYGNNRTIPVIRNKKAMNALANMRHDMLKLGLTARDVGKMTGMDTLQVKNYAENITIPEPKNYNKLAKVFHWPKLRNRKKANTQVYNQPKGKQLSYEAVQHPEIKISPIPGSTSFSFSVGQHYQFAREKYSMDHEYTFSYERKEGIHHVFREIHGGWSRTYTDAQLIGKTIMEVQE